MGEPEYDLQQRVLNALGALLRAYHEQLDAVSKEGSRNDGAPGLYAAQAFSQATASHSLPVRFRPRPCLHA
jgi:hypothetical protein